jgi:hypothetical protein
MSKKTLKSAKAKTRSALKQPFVICSLLFIVVGVIAWFNLNPKKSDNAEISAGTCIQIRQDCFGLEVADTDEKRIKGLSGRDSLPDNGGMLFVFDRAEEQCFWTKDMRFNLDIIWIDEQKKIIKIQENISPDTYPGSFCGDNTKYVLEFNRGFASKYGLKAGTTLQF